MKTETTTDNEAAIEFLKTCHPEWIDEMPITASMRGKHSVAFRFDYEGDKRRGVVATYFGAGYKRGEDGWGLVVFSEATEQEFDNATMRICAASTMMADLSPTGEFTFGCVMPSRLFY